MARSRAKELYKMLKAEGWKPRMGESALRNTKMFEHLSEACGCTTDGEAIDGAKCELTIGEAAGDFGIRDLFENLVVNKSDGEPVGSSFVDTYFNPRNQRSFSEAIEAVDSTAFAGVTGQLLVTQVLAPFQKEEYMVRKMFTTYNSPLRQERWIGMADPKDPGNANLRVQEGEAYRMFGFGEEYVETPRTITEGGIIGVTKNAIFADRTGQIVEKASQIGDLLAFNEEQECIGMVIGGTTDPIYFTEKRQFDSAPVTIDAYQASNGSAGNSLSHQLVNIYSSRQWNYVNDVPNTPLQDFEAIVTCDQYFSNIVDPNRGRPIVIGKPFVLAPHTQRIKLMRVIEAESLYAVSQQGITSPGSIITGSANVLNRIGLTIDQLKTSRLLKSELCAQLGLTSAQADQVWFYGDIPEACAYVVNWPTTVVQAPYNSEAEFLADIAVRFKASKQGRACWKNPRALLRVNYVSENQSLSLPD